MKKIFSLLIAIMLFPVIVFSQEKKISKKEVPEAVLKAFQTAYPNAKVHQYNKEIEKGKTFYEVESIDGNVKRDLLYAPDGSLAETEEIIPEKQLPDPVRDAISKKYAAMKISRIEKNTKGTTVEYEVLFKNKKQKKEIVFSPSGNIVKD